MKKLIFAALLVLVLMFATACGTGDGEGDTFTAAIVGEWGWQDSLYYTFNDDGTGRMRGAGNIRWATYNGILSICITPGMCRSVSRCSAPNRWFYHYDDETLTLSDIAGTEFVYTRR